jgi:hypothetical protein
MQAQHLGPHTFHRPPRQEHHLWLANFSPRQRKALIGEDRSARNHVAALLISVIGIGLTLLLITVVECM